MNTIAVSVPQEVMYDTKMSLEQTQKFVSAAAIEYYKNYGISVFQFDDKKEFLEEMSNA